MPTLPTQSFPQIVTNTISGMQGRMAKLVNFAIGSTLRAIAEGFAGLFLWFQALVLQLLTAIRLSTSNGVDVDTFTADFMPTIGISNGVVSPRLGATFASGQVTYTRFTAGPSTCFIPVGATAATNDGNATPFQVVANPTFATFNLTLNGYVLPANVASIVVPVACLSPGAIGNVQPGAISVMTSNVVGIDQVSNGAAFINGFNQETDGQLKDRFHAYILGLSRGDVYGLTASIEGAAVDVQWTLTEDYNYDGSYHPGYFFVVADDGSGSPSPAFLQMVMTAAQAVRPLSIQVGVFSPVVLQANVSMQIQTATGFDHNTVVAQVAAALAFNINSLGLGNSLAWGILYTWAYAIPGVTLVSNVLLNGNTGDSASVSATKLTQDGFFTIGYATIKSNLVAVS